MQKGSNALITESRNTDAENINFIKNRYKISASIENANFEDQKTITTKENYFVHNTFDKSLHNDEINNKDISKNQKENKHINVIERGRSYSEHKITPYNSLIQNSSNKYVNYTDNSKNAFGSERLNKKLVGINNMSGILKKDSLNERIKSKKSLIQSTIIQSNSLPFKVEELNEKNSGVKTRNNSLQSSILPIQIQKKEENYFLNKRVHSYHKLATDGATYKFLAKNLMFFSRNFVTICLK